MQYCKDGSYGETVITALCGSAVEGSIPSSSPIIKPPLQAEVLFMKITAGEYRQSVH